MSNLGPQSQNLSYAGLLQVPGGITASLQQVQDGDGNNTGLYLSSTGVSIAGFTATTTQNISGGAAGSLPYQSAINTTAFIPAGTNGYVLTSNGAAAPSWSATAPNALTSTTATNIAGGSTGFLPYQTAAGLTGFIGTGAIGQVLTSTGAGAAPVWSASSTIATALAGGSAGQLPYQSAAGVTSFLAAGSAGQLLRSNGVAAPSWVTLNAVSVGALAIDGTNAMTAALNAGNYKVVNLATPTLATDAATKSYVDSVATGLNIKAACVAATTANITLSGAQSVDGVPVGLGERVLVKNQTAQEENGIYVSAAGAWSRATDADTWSELVGATVFIEYGSVNDLTTWVSNVIAGGTLGVTPVVFVQFAATQSYTAGAGLSLVGNEFSLSSPVSVSNGGTGVSSLTGILFGNAGSAVTTATGAQIASGIGITPVLNASFAGTCSGNAQTATALQTARTINGVSFNGTSNITVTADTTNSLAFNNSGLGAASGVTFTGSLPQTISYNTIGAPSLTGVGATGTWPISVSGTSGGLSAASGVAPGTYSYATVTVNDKGLVTYAASNGVTSGTVTSVGLAAPTGFVVSGSPVTSSGTLTLGFAAGYSLPTNSAQIDWNTAYSQRFQWDGGATNLNATTGRASLGLGNVALINTNGSTSNYLRGDGNWVTPPSSGGTVTSVSTGTGLTGGPITTSGTISLANTSVAAGSYTNANITVDAQGRLTSASSGGGGGGWTQSGNTSYTSNDVLQGMTSVPTNAIYADMRFQTAIFADSLSQPGYGNVATVFCGGVSGYYESAAGFATFKTRGTTPTNLVALHYNSIVSNVIGDDISEISGSGTDGNFYIKAGYITYTIDSSGKGGLGNVPISAGQMPTRLVLATRRGSLTTPVSGRDLIGRQLVVAVSGSTNFISMGSSSNAVGTAFVCTANGSGSGSVYDASSYSDQLIPGIVIDSNQILQFPAYGAGTLSTTSNGYVTTSDSRYKTKTRSIQNGSDLVKQLNPTYYRWKEDSPFHGEYEELGFMAQEVAEVIPEASPEPESDNKMKNYHDRAIIAVLVESVKEILVRLDALESKINSMQQ